MSDVTGTGSGDQGPWSVPEDAPPPPDATVLDVDPALDAEPETATALDDDQGWVDDVEVDSFDPLTDISLHDTGDGGYDPAAEDTSVYDDPTVGEPGFDALDEDNFYGIVW